MCVPTPERKTSPGSSDSDDDKLSFMTPEDYSSDEDEEPPKLSHRFDALERTMKELQKTITDGFNDAQQDRDAKDAGAKQDRNKIYKDLESGIGALAGHMASSFERVGSSFELVASCFERVRTYYSYKALSFPLSYYCIAHPHVFLPLVSQCNNTQRQVALWERRKRYWRPSSTFL